MRNVQYQQLQPRRLGCVPNHVGEWGNPRSTASTICGAAITVATTTHPFARTADTNGLHVEHHLGLTALPAHPSRHLRDRRKWQIWARRAMRGARHDRFVRDCDLLSNGSLLGLHLDCRKTL